MAHLSKALQDAKSEIASALEVVEKDFLSPFAKLRDDLEVLVKGMESNRDWGQDILEKIEDAALLLRNHLSGVDDFRYYSDCVDGVSMSIENIKDAIDQISELT